MSIDHCMHSLFGVSKAAADLMVQEYGRYFGMPTVCFRYGGKQVRDNIHSADLVRAFTEFHAKPESAVVYNLGGGRQSNCSMLEAIEMCEQIAGRKLEYELSDQARMGDHRWWIGDLSGF